MTTKKNSDQDLVEVQICVSDPVFMLKREKGIDFYTRAQDQLTAFDMQNPKDKVPKKTYNEIASILSDDQVNVPDGEFELHLDNLCFLTNLFLYIENNLEKLQPWIEDAKIIEGFREAEKNGRFDKLIVSNAKGNKFQIAIREIIHQLFSPEKLEGRFKLINVILEAEDSVMEKVNQDVLSKTGENPNLKSTSFVLNAIGTSAKRRAFFVNIIALYIEVYRLVEFDNDDTPVKKQLLMLISRLLQASGYLKEEDFESSLEQIVRNSLNSADIPYLNFLRK